MYTEIKLSSVFLYEVYLKEKSISHLDLGFRPQGISLCIYKYPKIKLKIRSLKRCWSAAPQMRNTQPVSPSQGHLSGISLYEMNDLDSSINQVESSTRRAGQEPKSILPLERRLASLRSCTIYQ
jgi:hypothetical protein